jgi:hypothetical protein
VTVVATDPPVLTPGAARALLRILQKAASRVDSATTTEPDNYDRRP